MGARVAILVAARIPALLTSVTIVDIGPDSSRSNIEDTVGALSRRPERFANATEALAYAFRTRVPTPEDQDIFLARLTPDARGGLTWRSSVAALSACVSRQRSRSYWKEWSKLDSRALFIHGGSSNEVSVRIADHMRTRNPAVRFERLEGVGHNIPLIAPERLAPLLEQHWQSQSRARTY
jgi:pimeloyl-ACP methyl ester carboxylesterase